MKKLNIKTSIGLLLLAAAIISLSGCAAKKAAWGSMEKGMIMKYSFQPDRNLNYQTSNTFVQDMEAMGKKIIITSEGDLLMIMKPLVSKSNDLDYYVTIEEMNSKVGTPRGEMTADLIDVIGKSFNVTISELGKELEYSGAEAITYDYGMGETKNIGSEIQSFFPDLPDHPIKAGDTWENDETITEKTASGVMIMQFINHNTFEKLETINDYECMKINVVFTGTIDGEGEEKGMEMKSSGTVEGTSTWYYAYKEGIFVSQIVEGLGETTTEITGAQEMTLPATRMYTMRTELVKK